MLPGSAVIVVYKQENMAVWEDKDRVSSPEKEKDFVSSTRIWFPSRNAFSWLLVNMVVYSL